MTNYYSFANSATKLADPDDINVTHVSECGGCPIRGCIRSEPHDHVCISWDGNGYTHENTWISADAEHTVDLEENR